VSEDWQYLVHDLKVTEQPGYLHHKGKPVLSIWGMGFLDRHPPEDPAAAKRVVAWFKSGAPEECRVTYMWVAFRLAGECWGTIHAKTPAGAMCTP
jgi:hypothetical protein